jgi:hypothetical protein
VYVIDAVTEGCRQLHHVLGGARPLQRILVGVRDCFFRADFGGNDEA